MAKCIGMAHLRTYLDGRSKRDFAAQVGIAPVYLSHILSGHRIPSPALMLRIMEATGGEVDFNSWIESVAGSQASGSTSQPVRAA